jgi:hypothetical protein
VRRSEQGLLAAVLAVLLAGLVALGTVDSDEDGGTAGPGPSPSASPGPPPLTAGTMRVATFAPGSGVLVFTATVISDETLVAALRGPSGVISLKVTPETSGRMTVSGRVPLDCEAVRDKRFEALDLVLSRGDDSLVVPLPTAQLRAAATSACSLVPPVTAPTGSPVPK